MNCSLGIRTIWLGSILLACTLSAQETLAQQSTQLALTTPAAASAVPRLVNYNGVLKDGGGRIVIGVTGVTFAIYKDEQGGAPLWLETQNVKPDATGHYTVQLGSASAQGLPAEMFLTGEGRWLGIQIGSEPEQARALLVAVPYAMKAADAETVGGLPPSAFVLAAPFASANGGANSAGASPTPAALPPATVTGSGTADYVPLWTGTTALTNSVLFQTGSGAAAKIGINTITPQATLDVTGGATIRGLLNLPNAGNAMASAGTDSRPLGFVAAAFNSTAAASQNQVFHWQAEPVNNNTASASATLNLLFAVAPATVAETGLKINNKGQFTFAPGQTFPGTGTGSVTSVGSGTGLTGGPITSSGTLSVNSSVVPELALANTFTNTQTVNLASSGSSQVLTNAGSGAALYAQGAGLYSVYVAGGTQGVTAYNQSFPIVGITASGQEAVYGGNRTTGSTSFFGVFGENTGSVNGAGVYGQISSTGQSGVGSGWPYDGAGVWGDGGGSGHYGVLGTADDHSAGIFHNNSPTYYALYGYNDNTSGPSFAAYNSASKGCNIDKLGSINCTGSKNAVVPVDGGKRKVALSAIESPKNWFEDFGSDQLSNGAAVINVEPEFGQTVNTGVEYHVFLTPNGDCKGLYVSNKTATSFEVRELGGGTSNVRFDYRIVALRKNYENIRLADHTNDLILMRPPVGASVKRSPGWMARPSAGPIATEQISVRPKK